MCAVIEYEVFSIIIRSDKIEVSTLIGHNRGTELGASGGNCQYS
jgi:hypothetical protein